MPETVIRTDPLPIRVATGEDLAAVLNVLDGSGLQTASGEIKRAIERDEVLVATGSGSETGIGVIVLEGPEILSLAVRPRRRGQGIGSALVSAGIETRRQRLRESRVDAREMVVTFHESVAPFWQSLGFDCERIEGTDRYQGVRFLDVDS